MDWVSFDEIKKTVSLEMVINRYGWKLRRSGPSVLRGKCPLPSHTSKESTESFIATLDKGAGGAWSCHSNSCAANRGGKKGGNALDLVAAVEGCSIREAAIKLQTWFLVPAAGREHGKEENHARQTKREFFKTAIAGKDPSDSSPDKESDPELDSEKNDGVGECEGNKPLAFVLKSVDPKHPYLTERGLTEETIQTFDVGFFSNRGVMQNRIVIPIHNAEGLLVAYAGRSIDGSEPRYKFPMGFKKSLELFNLHRVKGESSVVVVEGFFDCMKVTQAGYACVALMGSTMSKVQEQLIAEHFGSVVLMLDGDDAGRSASEEIADRLQRVVFQVKTIELDQGVQPDALSSEELHRELAAMAW
jgi:DNA primase